MITPPMARIFDELAEMGFTFRAEGQRLAHTFKPKGPVDSAKMGDLLFSLNRYHRRAVDYLKGNSPQTKVVSFRKKEAL
jgi:hypothetical protein